MTNQEDISKIVNYMNNAELTFAEELYSGALFGGYGISISLIDKDGEKYSFSANGNMLYNEGIVPFYADKNLEDDLLSFYDSIDAEEQIINR